MSTNPATTVNEATFVSTSGPVGDQEKNDVQIYLGTQAYGPGWNFGNDGGWSGATTVDVITNFAQRGIKHFVGAEINSQTVGDFAGMYLYVNGASGATAESDEGTTGISLAVGENFTWFHGQVNSTSGTGDKTPALTYQSGTNWTTDGAFLLNISKGTVAGNLNGNSSQFNSVPYVRSLPVTSVSLTNLQTGVATAGSLPLTTAWGTVSGAINPPETTADINSEVTLSVTLGTINGTTEDLQPGLCFVAGSNYPEQAMITAAQASVNGTQQITVAVRNPNRAAMIFQGGIAGQYLSFDANLAIGTRSSYRAIGSLTGTDLLHTHIIAGSIYPTIPDPYGNEAATVTGPNSGFHLYPGAEVVSNGSVTANPTLEPNGVAWAVGDLVENPNNPAHGGNAMWISKFQITPTSPSYGSTALNVGVGGAGITGAFKPLYFSNSSNPGQYSVFGGPLSTPTLCTVEGAFGAGFSFTNAPETDRAFCKFQHWAGSVPSANFNGSFRLFDGPDHPMLYYYPSTGQTAAQFFKVEYGGLTVAACNLLLTANANLLQDSGYASFPYILLTNGATPNSSAGLGSPETSGAIWTDDNYLYRRNSAGTVTRIAWTSF